MWSSSAKAPARNKARRKVRKKKHRSFSFTAPAAILKTCGLRWARDWRRGIASFWSIAPEWAGANVPGGGDRAGGRGSSPAYQAAILRDVLDSLGVERAIVVGHSWGGTLAATFVLEHPHRVAGLVLLAPPLYPLARSMTWLYAIFAMPVAGWLYARTLALPVGAPFIGLGLGSAFLPQLPPRGYIRRTAAMLLLRPASFLANARDVADLKTNLTPLIPRYASLATPTVVITGTRDMVVAPRHHAFAFAEALPAAKLVVLPGVGHMLHHMAADRVIAEIEELMPNTE